MADSVGLALLVVLDRLTPAERSPFVLHDMFAVSFDEIASMVGRSPSAARELASRARRRVQGLATVSNTNLSQQPRVANAFLAALRSGDFDGLIAVLDPDVVVRIDEAACAQVRRERSAVRGTGPRERWPSRRLPTLRNRHLSMDEWDSSWLRADGCSGCSDSRSLAERLHKSMWLPTRPASASST